MVTGVESGGGRGGRSSLSGGPLTDGCGWAPNPVTRKEGEREKINEERSWGKSDEWFLKTDK